MYLSPDGIVFQDFHKEVFCETQGCSRVFLCLLAARRHRNDHKCTDRSRQAACNRCRRDTYGDDDATWWHDKAVLCIRCNETSQCVEEFYNHVENCRLTHPYLEG
ncbi:hypothetical protein EXIGLDRAFT_458431 [Exidia glandulosa HHB12029]|uniref:Uncharacterized protein n=1 Tax=Exidia glandulosa HHB12029 TaxID=1314781 RepID=A0A165PPF3_EXIGL|nr:hypothetical protein EXIGLDRAFT_458431 [Exidia glandulosa HHB12029]